MSRTYLTSELMVVTEIKETSNIERRTPNIELLERAAA